LTYVAYENSVVPNISPLNAKDDVELGTVLVKEKQIYLQFDFGLQQAFFHRFSLNSRGSKLKIFSKLNNFLLNSSKFPS